MALMAAGSVPTVWATAVGTKFSLSGHKPDGARVTRERISVRAGGGFGIQKIYEEWKTCEQKSGSGNQRDDFS